MHGITVRMGEINSNLISSLKANVSQKYPQEESTLGRIFHLCGDHIALGSHCFPCLNAAG